MKLSILIISYNTRDVTVECLQSVYAQTRNVSCEVVVVDNASSDGSADAIRTHFPEARLIARRDNPGFARANNEAAPLAAGDWLLLLNPDTVVLDRAIDRLVDFAARQTTDCICGGRTIYADGRLNPSSAWRRPTPWSVFCVSSGIAAMFPSISWLNPEAMPDWDRASARDVDIVSGCLLLIRRDLWNRLGGFDPMFFMYGEDADLCLRARRLGVRNLICPDATIIHHGGASERVRADKMVRLFKAKAQLFHRHWTARAALFGPVLLDLWAWTRMVAFAVAATFVSRHRESRDTWRSVFRRRSEWHSRPGVSSNVDQEHRNVEVKCP